MTEFTPRDPNFRERLLEQHKIQYGMHYIKAEMTSIEPGYVEFTMPYDKNLTQQNGYIHAGYLTTLADGAGGVAAATLVDAETNILAIEFKVNFMNPGMGDKFIARGQVVKSGRTITVSRVDVFAVTGGEEKLIAIMQQTLINLKKE
ncbi:MAG TPA: PaaI family thioesterase [bacterium]|jgi:uncharacterized protein (TIGR00369 family)